MTTPMNLILSIETAGSVCSVALHAASKLVATQALHVEKSYAVSLSSMIEHTIALSPYKKKDLDAIAVSSGPGSYTGLRIGAATAKGLCYALDIPLIAVPTLASMAHGMIPYNTSQALLCPMLDARNMKVYCLLTDAQGRALVPTHPQVITFHSFEQWLDKHPILFFGDGAKKYKSTLCHHHAFFVDHMHAQAPSMGVLAHDKFRQEAFEDLGSFTPLYLKSLQGER